MADGSMMELEESSEAWDNVSHWILQLPCVSDIGGEYKYLGDQQVVLNQWDNETLQGNWLFLEQDVSGDMYRLEAKVATCGAEQAQYEAPTEERMPSGNRTCVHHWIIETPSGPKSKGICKHCGEEREFDSYWDEYILEDRSRFMLGSQTWDAASSSKRDESMLRLCGHVGDYSNY